MARNKDHDHTAGLESGYHEVHTVSMIREYGQQLRSCLEVCTGDRERENVAASFGTAFRITHNLRDGE